MPRRLSRDHEKFLLALFDTRPTVEHAMHGAGVSSTPYRARTDHSYFGSPQSGVEERRS